MSDPKEVREALAESMQIPGKTPTRASKRLSSRRPLRFRTTPVAYYFPDNVRTTNGIDPALREAIRRVIKGESPWPLFVFGPPGIGKTCAALAIMDYTGGLYFTAATLAETVIEAQQGRLRTPVEKWPVSPPGFWQEVYETSLVVLDELGTQEKVKDHPYACVKRLLDEREGAPLIVLSNLGLQEISRLYDQRIASRLAGGTVIFLKGQDRRPLKENRNVGREEGRQEADRPGSQGDEPAVEHPGATR